MMGISYLSTCRPVNLSARVDRSGGKYRSTGHYRYFVLVQLSASQLVNLLTGSEVNIVALVLMGILYSFNCRHVNVSTRVDMSRR